MNNKKIYDIKLIKSKLNAALVLIEEIQNIAEDIKINDEYLTDAMGNLEDWYWEIEDIYEEIKE